MNRAENPVRVFVTKNMSIHKCHSDAGHKSLGHLFWGKKNGWRPVSSSHFEFLKYNKKALNSQNVSQSMDLKSIHKRYGQFQRSVSEKQKDRLWRKIQIRESTHYSVHWKIKQTEEESSRILGQSIILHWERAIYASGGAERSTIVCADILFTAFENKLEIIKKVLKCLFLLTCSSSCSDEATMFLKLLNKTTCEFVFPGRWP